MSTLNLHPLTKLTLLFISLTTMMSNVAIVTVIPHLKDYFSHEHIELLSRLMITLPSLTIAILAPFLSIFINKIGKKNSTIIALTIFAISGTAGVYLDSLNLLLASRAILGVAIAMLMIVSTSLVGDYFKDESRHKYMGLQSAFISVGGIIFVVGGGVLSDINWRLSFSIYFIGFLLLPLVIKYLLEVPVHTQKNTNSDTTINTNLFSIYSLAFIFMTIFYILPTQVPFLMINHFNSTGTLTGAIISVAFIFQGVGALSYAKLKQKFSYQTIYLFGLFLIGFGFILIGNVTHPYLFFLTTPFVGFAGGIMMTNITAWMLHKAHHTKRVKSSGFLTSSLFLGQFFSPIATMWFVQYFGVQKFFIIMGAFMIVCIIASLLVLNIKNK